MTRVAAGRRVRWERLARNPDRGPRAGRVGRCRPPALLDAMVLVAATALALALVKRLDGPLWGGCPAPVAKELPCLLVGTATVLVLRLRRPRPSWRRLMRQPGAVACVTVGA